MERSIEKDLNAWKISKLRIPLLLRGARQVGKTYIVEKFAQEGFSSFVSVNFEAQPEAIACFSTLDPQEILIRLETIIKQPIIPGKTLLFLDEIQACPQAIVAMRYFKEKLPALHLIGAGSLLEFALRSGEFSFPVGRVEFMYMKPLSFTEYLSARGKKELVDQLSVCTLEKPPTKSTHEELMQLVKEYFLVGGMPAAVSTFCETSSFMDASKMQSILLGTFRADFSKYATEAQQEYLKVLFDGIPQSIGQQFKYSKVDPNLRARELKQGLNLLEGAGLITPIHHSSAAGIPLAVGLKWTRFKLLFLDVGLMQRALQIQPELVFKDDLIQINAGALAEQFVGQELLLYGSMHEEKYLFYWEREKKSSDAEVDYLIAFKNQIIPVEVKAGSKGKLKSLYQFMEEKKSPFGIRISGHPLAFESNVLSIPFYLVGQLQQVMQFLL